MRWHVPLIAVPIAIAASSYALDFLIVSPIDNATFWHLAILVAKAAALVGAVVAARSFDRGDYLRRAWLFVASNYALIAATMLISGTTRPLHLGLNLIHLPGVDPGSPMAHMLRTPFVVSANVAAVIGSWQLARAWKVSGLDPATPAVRWAVTGCGLLIAILLAGIPASQDFWTLLHTPRLGAVDGLASELGDLLTFALVAPVLLTALALRGGLLIWPWALFTASQLSWMLFDAAANLSDGTWVPHPEALSDAFRLLACLLGLSSGLAQRWALHKR